MMKLRASTCNFEIFITKSKSEQLGSIYYVTIRFILVVYLLKAPDRSGASFLCLSYDVFDYINRDFPMCQQ